jgi:ribonuclease-3
MDSAPGKFESRLEYHFTDQGLLKQALTHRSFHHRNNERLEFLGDSVLGFVIAEALFHQFPLIPEGDLTRMRSRLVRGSTLAGVARNLGISEYLIMGEGELKSGGYDRDSILANTLEAIFGAIFVDGGFRRAKTVIVKQFSPLLVKITPHNLKDNKTRLQEMLQKQEKALPSYEVVRKSGKSHQLVFEVKCEIDHVASPFFAIGSSRRIAEQSAAEAALKSLLEVTINPA